jgi:hypothetical protein
MITPVAAVIFRLAQRGIIVRRSDVEDWVDGIAMPPPEIAQHIEGMLTDPE